MSFRLWMTFVAFCFFVRACEAWRGNLQTVTGHAKKSDKALDNLLWAKKVYRRAAASSSASCKKPIDLVFVLDSSERVTAQNWLTMLNTTGEIAKLFALNNTRFGVIQYNSNAEVPIPLSSFKDFKDVSKKINSIYYKPGGTRTDVAVTKANEVFRSAIARPASKICLVVTDAPSNDVFVSQGKSIKGADLIKGPASDLLKSEVTTFVAAVTERLTPEETSDLNADLGVLASEETTDHIFLYPSFDALKAQVATIAKKLCVVNGGWSYWSPWSTCSVTCGGGTKLRMRECNKPKPENGGLNCTGNSIETAHCNLLPCNGGGGCPNSGVQTTSGGCCVFPFVYNGVYYSVCTTVDNGNRPWCATTPNYDQDRQWGDCAQGSPAPSFPMPPNCVVKGGPNECNNDFELINVKDTQMSASSVYTKDTNDQKIMEYHAPSKGKLFNTAYAGAWCAEHKKAVAQDKDQFLQFDLEFPHKIGKIGTQGQHLDGPYNNWDTTYTVKYSLDGAGWTQYPELLEGNRDKDTVVQNVLKKPIIARFVQIVPKSWNVDQGPQLHDICMRVGLYKCKQPALVPVSPQSQPAQIALGVNKKSDVKKQKVATADKKSKMAQKFTRKPGVTKHGRKQ